jgi:hypothetical protein
VAYCCQLVDEPVLLKLSFPSVLLNQYIEFIRFILVQQKTLELGSANDADIQWALGNKKNVLETNSGMVYSTKLLELGKLSTTA